MQQYRPPWETPPGARVKLTAEFRGKLEAWFPDPGELKRTEEACEAVGGLSMDFVLLGIYDADMEQHIVSECVKDWQGEL